MVVREPAELDPTEAEFPPPKRHDIEKRPCNPSEVDERGALAARVLNKSGNATDEAHNAEPEEDADQHAHVQIEIDGNRGMLHRYPAGVPQSG
jgi:hypothetical protein